MIYALFTDSTHRTMNSFVDQFVDQAAFEEAAEQAAGYYDAKVITEDEYKAQTGYAHDDDQEMRCPHCQLTFEDGCDCISPSDLTEHWPAYGE